MPIQIIREKKELQECMSRYRSQKKLIGLVPTMGGLHAGHLSLLDIAKPLCDVLVMSLFVNPTQFAPEEDLEHYPRKEEEDLELAEKQGVDVAFCPTPSDMYPPGFQTTITLPTLSAPLCGENRPGHFQGVATVVSKLFNLTSPNIAVFGKKDAQQLAIIRQMVTDLDFDTTIIEAPIIRESDGLAMSSRNVYLSKEERRQATSLQRGLQAAKQRFETGNNDKTTLVAATKSVIGATSLSRIHYVELRDARTLEPIDEVLRPALLAVAASFGQTRLIDNLTLVPKNE